MVGQDKRGGKQTGFDTPQPPTPCITYVFRFTSVHCACLVEDARLLRPQYFMQVLGFISNTCVVAGASVMVQTLTHDRGLLHWHDTVTKLSVATRK